MRFVMGQDQIKIEDINQKLKISPTYHTNEAIKVFFDHKGRLLVQIVRFYEKGLADHTEKRGFIPLERRRYYVMHEGQGVKFNNEFR